ncbi:hypothetical protein GC177_07820 [bacterium]|nr:hypothetical protein [bacterium]
MPAQHRHTVEKIKSGAYFSEALTWYDAVYHAPIITKAYSVVVTMVAIGAIWFAISGLLELMPIQKQEPFVMVVKDLENFETNMKPLTNRTGDANEALLDFFVKDYVKNRESYDYSRFSVYSARIRAQSNDEAYSEYKRYQNTGNAESPVVRFEAHTIRTVRVTAIRYNTEPEFEDAASTPSSAIVSFEATETGPKGTRDTTGRVKLTFGVTPVEVNQDDYSIAPMQFQVTRYEALEDTP